MHIEKIVCENVICIILDIEGKSKDTHKARLDLEYMGIRKELWLQKKVLEIAQNLMLVMC